MYIGDAATAAVGAEKSRDLTKEKKQYNVRTHAHAYILCTKCAAAGVSRIIII